MQTGGGMNELEKAISQFGKATVDRAIDILTVTRRVKVRGRMRNRKAVASGNLAKSLTYKIAKTDKGYTVSFSAKGSAANYAAFIEFGVNGTAVNHNAPFSFKKSKTMIPVKPVLSWMKQKGIRPRAYKDGKLGGFIKNTKENRERAAFAIAKGIHRNGMPPLRYFQEAAEDTIKDWLDKLAQAAADDLANEI
jgi:hypothetical protein